VSVLGKLRGLPRAGGAQAVMTVDQLVFSAIAFALQAAAIPVSSDAEFGVLTLVMMIQTGQWYVGRALASEPMVVSRTAAPGGDRAGPRPRRRPGRARCRPRA
jgi:hypothetical protein